VGTVIYLVSRSDAKKADVHQVNGAAPDSLAESGTTEEPILDHEGPESNVKAPVSPDGQSSVVEQDGLRALLEVEGCSFRAGASFRF
jgi:hypothetical protein